MLNWLAVLLETAFYESILKSESNPYNFEWCRDDHVCVDPVSQGSSTCFFDDGSPLYTFKCGTLEADCVYGVANFVARKRGSSEHCNGGSFFASVPFFFTWLTDTMWENRYL